MLTSLHIKNFRMLEDFQVPKLGRVNLIVGKNNCGKSTVLEALRIYAGRAKESVLKDVLSEHHELEFNKADDIDWSCIRNLFSNRDSHILEISSDEGCLRLTKERYHWSPDNTGFTRKIAGDGDFTGIRINFDTTESWLDFDEQSIQFHRPTNTTWKRNGQPSSIRTSSYSLVPTGLLSENKLYALWEKIVYFSLEERVLIALRIVEPKIQKLFFMSQSSNGETNNWHIMVKLQDYAEPVPLKSMGDGVARILQIMLAGCNQHGVLLIDEFENGLHFSVQQKVWQMLFQLAQELNIQVFATTHSWDCIESFSKVAAEHPDEGILFKMFRSPLTSENGKTKASIYTEKDLQIITATELEVR